MRGILADVGFADATLARETPEGLVLIDGHLRAELAPDSEIPVLVLDVTAEEADRILATHDPVGAMAGIDEAALGDLLNGMNFENAAAQSMMDDLLPMGGGAPGDEAEFLKLSDEFLIPPFSVLDTRQGYWQDRKRAWMALGIQSELGRDAVLMQATGNTPEQAKHYAEKYARGNEPDSWILEDGGVGVYSASASVFDPVLCELAYSWFCPPGGAVLDPFAGGSVRGIVAAACGRFYSGIDLRPEQITSNVEQWEAIRPGLGQREPPPATVSEPATETPLEQVGPIWVKRDDLFSVAGVRGGKVRTCLHLAAGAAGLVTAGSRSSPQVNIVAHIANHLGIGCRVHTPEGDASPEVQQASALGAERIEHRPGHNSVIIKRARDDAAERKWTEIPFGMECPEAVEQTRQQVPDTFPAGVTRVLVPVGSGMSLAGILWGMVDKGHALPVLGVMVGANPEKRLDKYAPPNWREMATLEPAGVDYKTEVTASVGNIILDPVYEAKCEKFIKAGDLFWIIGVRSTAAGGGPPGGGDAKWFEGDSENVQEIAPLEYDFIFSCPPYGDLEKYSDDPADLSTMDAAGFLASYRRIISAGCKLLKENRFACFVVGEYRGAGGHYANFVSETIRAFMDAGLEYYNEMILVTPAGSLPLRARRQFNAGRKIGKMHQNVLLFCKGDAKIATADCGDVIIFDPVTAVDQDG